MKLKSEMYIGAVMMDADVLIKYPVPYDAIATEYQELYIEIQKRVIAGHPVEPLDIWVTNKDKEWADKNVLVTMMTNACIPQKAKYYAEQLMQGYRKNKFKMWLLKAQELVGEGDIEKAEAELISLYEENYEAPYLPLRDLVKHKTEALPRIETGETLLDRSLIIDKGGFHVIAGRPGMGKTSFALWLVSQVVKTTPVLFLSLEMPNAQLVRKLTIPDDSPLYISDAPSQTIEAIVLKAQLAKRHKDIGMVVVDYMQLIRTKEKFNNREQQVSYISSTLKQMAKQLNVPVIACCQLNRMMEATGDCRPSLSHLRESGSIEQDCDSVTLLYRPEYYYKLKGEEVPEHQQGRCAVIIAKQRNAPTNQLEAKWNPEDNSWSEWRYYEYKAKGNKAVGRVGQVDVPHRADWD